MDPIAAALSPWDSHNQELARLVHPPDWRNPKPADRYHLVVLGGGTAGLVTAAGAAGLGARVALVERHLLGGDCLNVGCVPSKTLLNSARAAADARHGSSLGLRASGVVAVDFPAVMERVRSVRARLAPHDSAARFRGLGVDVFLGDARFRDAQSLEVAGTILHFSRGVIATGERPRLPDIPGLAELHPLTNETIFNLTALPPRLAVLGGGPIGCELAQAFQRLGSQVTLLHDKAHLLDRDDPDAAAVIQDALRADGVQLVLNARLHRIEPAPGGDLLHYSASGQPDCLRADRVLCATGRSPNIDGLNLATAGIEADPRHGVLVDDFLRTTNPRVYACGDVCLRWRFTHAADATARIVIQNALFSIGPFGRRRLSSLNIPWCTYTDPEIAHIGLGVRHATEQDVPIDTFVQPFALVDRAITDDTPHGFVKILTARGTDRIVGATIVGPHAGDLISEVAVAMTGRVGLGRLASVIHPYPTLAEAIRKCGDQYQRTRLTPRIRSLLRTWLSWRAHS